MVQMNILKKVYAELKKAHPDEVLAFCCDLDDSWLFKFIPKSEKGNPNYISGFYATRIHKQTGKVSQCNMLDYMETIEQKKNLANKLN